MMKTLALAALLLPLALAGCGAAPKPGSQATGRASTRTVIVKDDIGRPIRLDPTREISTFQYADVKPAYDNCPMLRDRITKAMRDGVMTYGERISLYAVTRKVDRAQRSWQADQRYHEARTATDPSYKAPTRPYADCDVGKGQFRGRTAFEPKQPFPDDEPA